MADKVSVNELAISIEAELREYSQEVADALKDECKRVAKETTAELKQTSPKKSGEYAGGWKTKTAFEDTENIRLLVHNGKKPQLTHLLEFGHATKNGTGRTYERTPAHPHIQVAEKHAREKLDSRIKVRLK